MEFKKKKYWLIFFQICFIPMISRNWKRWEMILRCLFRIALWPFKN